MLQVEQRLFARRVVFEGDAAAPFGKPVQALPVLEHVNKQVAQFAAIEEGTYPFRREHLPAVQNGGEQTDRQHRRWAVFQHGGFDQGETRPIEPGAHHVEEFLLQRPAFIRIDRAQHLAYPGQRILVPELVENPIRLPTCRQDAGIVQQRGEHHAFQTVSAELRQVRGQVPERGDGKPIKQGPGILHAQRLGDVATRYGAGRHAGAGLQVRQMIRLKLLTRDDDTGGWIRLPTLVFGMAAQGKLIGADMHGDGLAIDPQFGGCFGKIATHVIDQQIGQLLLFTVAPHACQGLFHGGHCSASFASASNDLK